MHPTSTCVLSALRQLLLPPPTKWWRPQHQGSVARTLLLAVPPPCRGEARLPVTAPNIYQRVLAPPPPAPNAATGKRKRKNEHRAEVRPYIRPPPPRPTPRNRRREKAREGNFNLETDPPWNTKNSGLHLRGWFCTDRDGGRKWPW